MSSRRRNTAGQPGRDAVSPSVRSVRATFPDVSDRPFALPNKYKAKATIVDGIRFASQKEAGRWCELQLLQRAGQIRNLERQVPLTFFIEDEPMFEYVADFAYLEGIKQVYEDTKGHPTPVYKLKKRLIEKQYSIEIRET